MTAQDLIVRLAVSAGLAVYENPGDENDNTARIPTNPGDLDACWRAINDAISYIARGAYINEDGKLRTHEWRCLTQTVTIPIAADGSSPNTVNGDTGIYALPWYMDATTDPAGWLCYGSGLATPSTVMMTTIRKVRAELLASSVSAGVPLWAAAEPTKRGSPQGTNRRGWDLHIAPLPNGPYTLECNVRVRASKMTQLDERHVFGAIHDETVIAVARWMIERDRRSDPETVASLKEEAEQAIATSVQLDGENTPNTIGLMTDPGNRVFSGNSNHYDVYLNGVRRV